MEGAHRRDEPDRAPCAPGRGERVAQLADACGRPHAGTASRRRARVGTGGQRPGGVDQGVEQGQQIGRPLGDRVALARRPSPRRPGPPGRSGRARGRAGPSSRPWRGPAGASSVAAGAGARGEALGGRLERDQEVRGDRGGGVVGGAVLIGDLDGRMPSARASVSATASARGWRRRSRRRPREARAGVVPGGHGHQRMQRERLVRGEHVQAGGPGAMSDEGPGRHQGSGGGDLGVGHAEQDRVDARRRGLRVQAARRRRRPAARRRRGREGAAEPAAADDGQARRAAGASAEGVLEDAVPVPASEIPVGIEGLRIGFEVRPESGDGLLDRRIPRLATAASMPAVTSATERRERLKAVYEEARGCVRCPLHQTRTQVVFGIGQRRRRADVHRRGAGGQRGPAGPAVRRARPASCWTSCWARSGSSRGDVFIANVFKCRPPGNRDPQPNEIESCQGYLRSQVELIEPTMICTLGNFSTKLLRADTTGISRLHGQAEELHGRRAPVRLYPLYHPAAALYTRRRSRRCAPTSIGSRSCWRSGRWRSPSRSSELPEPEPEPSARTPRPRPGPRAPALSSGCSTIGAARRRPARPVLRRVRSAAGGAEPGCCVGWDGGRGGASSRRSARPKASTAPTAWTPSTTVANPVGLA